MINMLEDSIAKGTAEETTVMVIKSLVFYTKWHFSEEEKIMTKLGYSEIETHKFHHKSLSRQLAGKLLELKDERSVSAYDIIAMLKKWFISHIMVEDRKIGLAYKNKVAVPS